VLGNAKVRCDLAGTRISGVESLGDFTGVQEPDLVEDSVPEWEEYPHTPAIFVRVAKKGVRAYGTWKNIRNFGSDEEAPYPSPPLYRKECGND
jgi:hypothetical protein